MVWTGVGVLAFFSGAEVLEKNFGSEEEEAVSWVSPMGVGVEEAFFSTEVLLVAAGVEYPAEMGVVGEAGVAGAELVAFHLLVFRISCVMIEANLFVILALCFPQLSVKDVVLNAFPEITFAFSLVFRPGFPRSSKRISVDYF